MEGSGRVSMYASEKEQVVWAGGCQLLQADTRKQRVPGSVLLAATILNSMPLPSYLTFSCQRAAY